MQITMQIHTLKYEFFSIVIYYPYNNCTKPQCTFIPILLTVRPMGKEREIFWNQIDNSFLPTI